MDKLLNDLKDFSAIKRYLEAINQTTDDFLYMYDIKEDQLQFFGPITAMFKVGGPEREVRSFKEILPLIHPADQAALITDIENLRSGAKDLHDIDLR